MSDVPTPLKTIGSAPDYAVLCDGEPTVEHDDSNRSGDARLTTHTTDRSHNIYLTYRINTGLTDVAVVDFSERQLFQYDPADEQPERGTRWVSPVDGDGRPVVEILPETEVGLDGD